MECSRCGEELKPGMRECPVCGNEVFGNDFVYASITVSRQEARRGCLVPVELNSLAQPIKVRLKPRTRNGDKIRVPGAIIRMPDETVLLAPLEITVHVEPIPVWQSVMAASAGILLLVCMILGGTAIAGYSGEKEPDSTNPTYSPTAKVYRATEPAPTTDATAPATEPETTADSDPDATQPQSTEETLPQSTEETQPEDGEDPGSQNSVIPNMALRPLLQQLTPEQLADVEVMYQAAVRCEATCELPYPVPEGDQLHLLRLMYYECPELIHLDITQSHHYWTDANGNVTQITLPLTLDKTEYDSQYALCQSVVNSLAAQCEGMTDREKEAFVFDYITTGCVYDKSFPNSWNPCGVLLNNTGKCDGFSKTTKWLLMEMGITCIAVTGDPVQGETGHAWNYVLLDGQYYGLDVTADVPLQGNPYIPMYKAFNVSTVLVEQTYILTDTFRDYVSTPSVTTMDESYHVQHGSYLYTGDDWQERIRQEFLALCNAGGSFVLQFESQEDFDACLTDMNDVLTNAAIPYSSYQTWYSEEFRVMYVTVSVS